MNTNPIPASANVRTADLVARADGSPIVAGATVNYYVIANTGANAGNWFDGSSNTWSATEVAADSANMSHKADGHWQVSINAACWIDGVEYTEYAKESGDLHIPVSKDIRCHYQIGTSSAGKVSGVVLTDGCTTNADMRGTDGANTTTPPTVNEVRDGILDDATRFAGADIDVAISSRSSHSANDVRDAILDDATRFSGADIDAAISSRSSHTAADAADAVWDEVIAGHLGAGSAGLALFEAWQTLIGGWEIIENPPASGNFYMVFYRDDNITELFRVLLSGNPGTTDLTSRTHV